ncbi:UDP-glucose/GDP-mannose dehydrogenase family protein [Pullulanibacillus sp. KACC 23026]|uniref:UDP-glucose dehydrogenase family protein n=1 Tax=Pullulanibacillus sp. KACC 23026 TaxID=3028315 RepID=UPI0023B1DDFD|nr:UDP-glucose/GDP-mannose dehydrogenase family protein [Pullulanibacillus sp. KACC 23026]WEG13566.1 UDP-glucose/GDP-mannose dehydrogenase family protein [Pullulanibacillus sp. KACC 23026]
MNIAIIGAGYVGMTTSLAFGEAGHHVWVMDTDKAKITQLKKATLPFYEAGAESLLQELIEQNRLTFETELAPCMEHCDLLFMTVGTPSLPTGGADLRYVETVSKAIGQCLKSYKIVVIKSTVPVGTSEKVKKWIEIELEKRGKSIPFDIVSNPEFLREGRALDDAREPDRIVIGCQSNMAEVEMKRLYKDHLSKCLFTTARNAEMIKYASNAFLATKISFINEIARLCDPLGTDVREVARGIGLDHRIGPHFLHAGIGYGGSCFPKDVKALLHLAEKNQTELPVLQAVDQMNAIQANWFINKVKAKLGSLTGKHLALLGLTFKPETDDIREATALRLIDILLKEGAHLTAFDPKGTENVKTLYPSLTYATTPLEAVRGADAILLVTEWKDIVEMDWKTARQLISRPFLFDGRNALDPVQIRALGFDYQGVGRH